MKKTYYVAVLAIGILALFSSCQKTDFCNPDKPAKNKLLKQLVYQDRSYDFFYNHRGLVDSVQANDKSNHYTYRVYYSGSRIDSTALIDGGVTLSTHTNVVYSGNNIVSYEYHWYEDEPEFKVKFEFAYDSQGNIIAVKQAGLLHFEITYDSRNDAKIWTMPGLMPRTDFYTYDDKLNPLYNVDNLFVIFVEEPYIWPYAFSQHNSLSKNALQYVNNYNSLQQLVKKTGYDTNGTQGEQLLFSYYP